MVNEEILVLLLLHMVKLMGSGTTSSPFCNVCLMETGRGYNGESDGDRHFSIMQKVVGEENGMK